MTISINPFKGIIETTTYPHAKALRTTLWQKIKYNFKVFFGHFDEWDVKSSHVGVFDFLLLGLVPLLDKTRLYLIEHHPEKNKTISFFEGLINALQICLALPRLIFAAVMTLVCFIPLGFIHLVTRNDAKEDKKIINELKVINITPLTNNDDLLQEAQELETGKSFEEQLKENDACLEDISDIQTSELLDKPGIRTLQFFLEEPLTEDEAQHASGVLFIPDAEVKPIVRRQKQILEFNFDATQHARFFQSLHRLNVGNIQSKLERENEPRSLEMNL